MMIIIAVIMSWCWLRRTSNRTKYFGFDPERPSATWCFLPQEESITCDVCGLCQFVWFAWRHNETMAIDRNRKWDIEPERENNCTNCERTNRKRSGSSIQRGTFSYFRSEIRTQSSVFSAVDIFWDRYAEANASAVRTHIAQSTQFVWHRYDSPFGHWQQPCAWTSFIRLRRIVRCWLSQVAHRHMSKSLHGELFLLNEKQTKKQLISRTHTTSQSTRRSCVIWIILFINFLHFTRVAQAHTVDFNPTSLAHTCDIRILISRPHQFNALQHLPMKSPLLSRVGSVWFDDPREMCPTRSASAHSMMPRCGTHLARIIPKIFSNWPHANVRQMHIPHTHSRRPWNSVSFDWNNY